MFVHSIETNVSVWIWSRHSWLLSINEICKVHTMFITCSNMYTLTRCTIIVDALNSEKAPFHSPVETEGQAIVRGEGEDVATITIPWCLQVILKDHALQKLPVARKEKMEQTHDSTGRQLGKDGGERWGVTEELCIYSFWHADANLDLDVLPSLTARKAKKKSPEFGCLPSEDEQWNGQKHSSPMVQRSDYPPHSPQMAYGMATRWSNSRSEYPALNIQPFQRALMWIHKYKSSYHDNEGTSTSEDLLIYSYIHTQVNFECLLQSKPVDSVVQSSSQLDFAGKSRTTTMEWQRENDLDHSHGSQLTRPANESFSFSRRCNWYSSLWLTIIQ